MICAINGCFNKPKTGDGFSFFNFPRDPIMKEKWYKLCNRSSDFNANTSRICEVHFDENDFEKHKNKLVNKSYRKKLKKDAIPSINMENKTGRTELSSESADSSNSGKFYQYLFLL